MSSKKINFPYKAFVKNPNSYEATEIIIALIKKQGNIRLFSERNIDYLYNVKTNTAILLKSITRPTQRRYRNKKPIENNR